MFHSCYKCKNHGRRKQFKANAVKKSKFSRPRISL